MTNSKQKGKRGELEIANILKEHGYDCRRTAQYNGKEQGSLADVIGLDGIHIEVKRVERINIDVCMEQAIRDCQDDIPTVAIMHGFVMWQALNSGGPAREAGIELYESWKHGGES